MKKSHATIRNKNLSLFTQRSSCRHEEEAIVTGFANVLATCAIATCALVPATGAVAELSLRDRLVGTWSFVSTIETNPDGSTTDRWGPNARGLTMFDTSGRFVFLISRADIPKFASGNVNMGTAEENRAVVQGMIAFSGTWSVDEVTGIQTMNIEAGSFPNLVGVSAKRLITALTSDEYRYTNAATATGASTDAVWRRAK
jgi:hypothetical protein